MRRLASEAVGFGYGECGVPETVSWLRGYLRSPVTCGGRSLP